MSIRTSCPSCEAAFRLSDTLAGKRVQCQKCMTRFIVPSPGSTEMQPGIPVESVSTMPGNTAPKPTRAKSTPAADTEEQDEPQEMDVEVADESPRRKRRDDADEEDDEDRPRRKRRDDTEDEDNEDRPRRKRRDDTDNDDDDEDEDDRPRRRRKKKAARAAGSSKMPLILTLVGVGVVLLACVGVGVGAYMMRGAGGNQGGATVVNFAADNTFRSDSSLRIWDPTKDRRHFRLYTVQMEPGKTYDIDMSSRTLDSYLVLLDENNLVMREDDDSGGNLNAHITFTPVRAGNFQIEASTFDDHETGNFTLLVRRR